MRRAARTDANQPDLVRLLRQRGCHVWITSALGSGAPDLVVSKGMRSVLVEVKDGHKPLTEDEETFRLDCRGKAAYRVVENEADALAIVEDLNA